MFKMKLLIISLLIILLFCAHEWLYDFNESQIALKYQTPLLPFVKILNQQIEIYEDDNRFKPEHNLKIYDLLEDKVNFKPQNKPNLRHYFVYVSNSNGEIIKEFDVLFKSPKVVEVIKEVYVKEPIQNNQPVFNNQQTINSNNNEPYLEGTHDINIPNNSDLHILVSELSSGLKTNCQISIDYSEVNLSAIGQYHVYYHYGNQTKQIIVTVY